VFCKPLFKFEIKKHLLRCKNRNFREKTVRLEKITPKEEKQTPIVPKIKESSRKFDSIGDNYSLRRGETPIKPKKQEMSRNNPVQREITPREEKFRQTRSSDGERGEISPIEGKKLQNKPNNRE